VLVWSPTSLWYRRAGWGRLVDISFWGRLGAYSPFYVLVSESFLEGLWLRILRIFIYVFGFMLRNHWVHIDDVSEIWYMAYIVLRCSSSGIICISIYGSYIYGWTFWQTGKCYTLITGNENIMIELRLLNSPKIRDMIAFDIDSILCKI